MSGGQWSDQISRQPEETTGTGRGVNLGPSYSFIIEWDNARLSELGRARQMLKALQEQVVAHRPKPEKHTAKEPKSADRGQRFAGWLGWKHSCEEIVRLRLHFSR